MNILLTGGSGFIGRNILESYLTKKYKFISPTSKELDLSNEKNVDFFFENNNIDIVIHAAVKPSHRNAKDFSNLFYTNSRMFFNLERHCNEYKKMLVLGSGAIYDLRNYRPKMKEYEWTDNIPADDHGYCKYVCEKIIEKSKNIYDLRIFGIFGKYEDYAIRFISNAICKVLYDLPITIKQNRKFDYIYVNDLIPIIDWFIENEPKYHSYNITPDSSISLFDLAQLVLKVSGKKLPIIIGKEGLGLEYSGNNSLLREEYDKLYFTPIEDAIKDLYNWYRDNINIIDN